jgi:hypothetical protein
MATKKASDITAHVGLDTSELKKGLDDGSKSIKSFTADINQASKSGLGGFISSIGGASAALKALPIVGAVAGIGKLTQSIMESSQASDGFLQGIAAAKTSIDSFFSAISIGDWSAFNDGILGAIANARELAATLDTLGDIQLANEFVTAEYESALANARAIMNDSTKADKEKAEALEAVRVAQQRAIEVNEDYISGTKKAIINTYKSQTGIEDTVENIIEYIRSGYKLDAAAAEAKAEIEKIESTIRGRMQAAVKPENREAFNEETAQIQRELNEYKKLNAAAIQWQKFNDEERQSLSRLARERMRSTSSIDGMTKAYNKLENQWKKTGEAAKKTEKKTGEDAAKAAEKQYEARADFEKKTADRLEGMSRIKIHYDVDWDKVSNDTKKLLEDPSNFLRLDKIGQKELYIGKLGDAIKLPVKTTLVSPSEEDIKRFGLKNQITVTANLVGPKKEDVKKLGTQEIFPSLAVPVTLDLEGFKQQDINRELKVFLDNLYALDVPNLNPLFTSEQNIMYDDIIKRQNMFADAIKITSDALGENHRNVNNLRKALNAYNLSLGKTSPLQYLAINFTDKYGKKMDLLADTFGSIGDMFGTSENAGMKQAALAFAIAKIITGGAVAIATAFETETWIGGIAAAAATAASLATTIASFNSTANRYAYGGIVPGSSFNGDHVHALVNSGEMILNRAQQGNLFDLINGGAKAGGDGGGAFVLRGTDLIAVANNTVAKAGRVRYRY